MEFSTSYSILATRTFFNLLALKYMRLFGLIGYPLTHSFSKGYFSDKFSKENLSDCRYNNYSIEDISLLPEILNKNRELIGLNITIPYKEKVIPFLNEMSTEAKEIGAVNTVRVLRDNNMLSLEGFNTDVFGFLESLRPLLSKQHKSALVLGTGGASKAVKFALKKLGIIITSVSRKKSENNLTYEELTKEIIHQNQLIINTTPLGTFPKTDEYPLIPYQYLSSQHLLYDLVYNPAITAFLNQGLNHNCQIKNGLEMLHLQAEQAWKIWNSNEQ